MFAGHDAEVFFIIERKRMNAFDMIDEFMRSNDKRSRVIKKGSGKLVSLSLTGLDCAIGIIFCKSADHSWKFRACWKPDVLNGDFCVLVRSEQTLLLSTVIDLQNFLCPFFKDHPGRSQIYMVMVAFKQVKSQFLFHLLNLLGDGGLGNVQ